MGEAKSPGRNFQSSDPFVAGTVKGDESTRFLSFDLKNAIRAKDSKATPDFAHALSPNPANSATVRASDRDRP
jgi:hypothetical protein